MQTQKRRTLRIKLDRVQAGILHNALNAINADLSEQAKHDIEDIRIQLSVFVGYTAPAGKIRKESTKQDAQ